MTDTAWRKYESYIHQKLTYMAGEAASVEFDRKLPGRFSETDRQIDVLITGGFAGDVEKNVVAIVDCKRYTRKIDVTHVEAFIGLAEDVNADLGFLITNTGFSAAAKRRASHGHGIRLRVFVAEIERLPRLYSASFDEAYYSGDFWELAVPFGLSGAMIEYNYVEESDYPYNPELGLEWSTESLASDTTDKLDWADDASRAYCSKIVLSHKLGRDPTRDEIEEFVETIAWQWEAGQPWVLYVGDLARAMGI
jgi:Restriction endonuclease